MTAATFLYGLKYTILNGKCSALNFIYLPGAQSKGGSASNHQSHD